MFGTIGGYVAKEVETFKFGTNGHDGGSFRVSESYYDAETRQRMKRFIQVKIFGRNLRLAEFIKKGRFLMITGDVNLSVYNDKVAISIIGENIVLGPDYSENPKPSVSRKQMMAAQRESGGDLPSVEDFDDGGEDIPF